MQGRKYNRQLGYLGYRLRKMLEGEREVSLRGNTLRSMKIFKSENLKAFCGKCSGTGNLDGKDWAIDDLFDGRGQVCFACDGRGHFKLVHPDMYRRVFGLWVMSRLETGQTHEIDLLCVSELEYIGSLPDEGHDWEWGLMDSFAWALDRLKVYHNTGVFFPKHDPKRVELWRLYCETQRKYFYTPSVDSTPSQNEEEEKVVEEVDKVQELVEVFRKLGNLVM